MASQPGSSHPLKVFLQLQLASDSYAVSHLPYVLQSLGSDALTPSPHLQKWTARISSLIHSQDAGARWAGLCLAYRTSVLSKSTMVESAQSWIGLALPVLSKNDPVPNLKASIRLLRYIFSGATDIPEFQRQLATPNVPKFSQLLVGLVEKHHDLELKLLALNTLALLVPIYPTLHRATLSSLSSLCLRLLNGAAPTRLPNALVKAASSLYAVLPCTGGKVGAASQWRKSVDDTLAFAWATFHGLRSTFPHKGHVQSVPSTEDQSTLTFLNLDRLRCGVTVLCDLLKSTTSRPVQVPIGSLLQLVVSMLSCIHDEKVPGPVDQSLHAVEVSVIPAIWTLGCDLLICIATCTRRHLTPNVSRLLSIVAYHIEHEITSSQRLSFLQVIPVILSLTHPSHDAIMLNRLARAILPSLTVVLLERSDVQIEHDTHTRRNKKGKKRGRGYEGDEVFKVARKVICLNATEGDVVLAALEALKAILRNPHLSPAVQSLSGRILLSMLLSLPQIPRTLLSTDLTLHGRLLAKVQDLCIELGIGTTGVMSKSLGLVVGAMAVDGSEQVLGSIANAQREVDLILHPRVPPLIRTLPHVETLSLFRAEESEEETQLRESLHLAAAEADKDSEDVTPIVAETHIPRNSHGMVHDQAKTKMGYETSKAMAYEREQRTTPVLNGERDPLIITPPMGSEKASPLISEPQNYSVAQSDAHPTVSFSPAPSEPLIPPTSTLLPMISKSQDITVTDPHATGGGIDEEDDEMPPIDMDSDSD